MIMPFEVHPGDEGLALRVLGYARNLAPCLDSLDGAARDEALAILQAVAEVVAGRAGTAGLKSRAVGDWSWSYLTDAEMGSVFSADDRASLARLCGVSAHASRGPVGSFPEPAGAWRT